MTRNTFVFSFSIVIFAIFSVCSVSSTWAATDNEKEKASEGSKFVLQSPDGGNSLTFGLTVQMLYEYYEKDMGPNEHPEYSSIYRWRRIRPTLRGTMLDGDLRCYLHINAVPGALELMDFNIEYAFRPEVQLRFGQFKIPFTRYRIHSNKNLQFSDWAIVTRYFGAERQVGFSLHNGYEKPMPFEYELGLFNGLNSRKSHGIGIAEVSGEKVGNPSDLVEPVPYDEFHPSVVCHLAYNYGRIVTSYETDFAKRGFRFAGGASAIWDANPAPYRDFSLRLAPEFLMKVRGFAISGTYYVGFHEKDSVMERTALDMTGAVVQTSYLIGQWVEPAVRYAYVGTTSEFRIDASRRASSIIAATDKEKREEIKGQYANAGRLKAEREYTVGLNVYMVRRTLKLQNDMSILQHLASDGDIKQDLRFRSQLQLAF